MSATITKIDRTALLTLFQELSIKGPNDSWPNERLLMKATKLPGLVGEAEFELSRESKEVLDDIVGTLKDEGEIEIYGGPKAKAKAKGKASNGKAKKAKDKRGESTVEKDKFGSRTGTLISAVNQAIGKKPQTCEEIMSKAGIEDKTKYKQNHLKYLLNEGYIKRDKDGRYYEA